MLLHKKLTIAADVSQGTLLCNLAGSIVGSPTAKIKTGRDEDPHILYLLLLIAALFFLLRKLKSLSYYLMGNNYLLMGNNYLPTPIPAEDGILSK
jgi:hypothetical protein